VFAAYEIAIASQLVAMVSGQLFDAVHGQVVLSVRWRRAQERPQVHDAEDAARIAQALQGHDRVVGPEERPRVGMLVQQRGVHHERAARPIQVGCGPEGQREESRASRDQAPDGSLPCAGHRHRQGEGDPEAHDG
jgi:hypothetical protein